MEIIDLLFVKMTSLHVRIAPVQDPVQIGKRAAADWQFILSLQAVGASDHLLHSPESAAGHDLPKLPCNEIHVVHHVLRSALETASEALVLGRDACGAGILRAHAHHHAAHGDQRSGRKAEFLGAKKRCDGHVTAAHQLSVRLQDDTVPEPVLDQSLMGLCDPQLPGKARMVHRREGRGAGSSVIA